jgi:hypothetical protein
MLSVVNVETAPVVPAGTLMLVGDGLGDQVTIQSDPSVPNQFDITAGTGTVLTLNAPAPPPQAPTFQTLVVNGINGLITVTLGGGGSTFDFAGPGGGGTSNVPAGLSIVDGSGGNVDGITNVNISGPLTVTNAPAIVSNANLTIASSTVTGNTIVTDAAAGGSGNMQTFINGGSLLGTFSLTNSLGSDSLMVTGASQFGASVPLAVPVVGIDNAASTGGTFTDFTGGTSNVYGGLTITNGSNLQGFANVVNLAGAQVLGAVSVSSVASTSSLTVSNSNLETEAAPTVPMAVDNTAGFASLSVTGSSIPWGLSVNNAFAGPTTFGSNTSIIGSSIGANLGVLPPGLTVVNSNGPNNEFLQSNTIGSLDLAGGTDFNTITLDSNKIQQLTVGPLAGSNNKLVLMGGVITQSINVNLGLGNNELDLISGSLPIGGTTVPTLPTPQPLPFPPFTTVSIIGGTGINTFGLGAGISLPPGVSGFTIFKNL